MDWMKEEKEKILTNVFVPAGENKLRLCNISFNEKIEKVTPITDYIFDWNELKDNFQREKLVKQFSSAEETITEAIDGNFLLSIPGAVDPHVHFNTPGFEFRDTFREGSLAAAYGGVTTVIDMPCTSIPPVTDLTNFNNKANAVRNRSHVDYAFWGGIRGNEFESSETERNIIELAEAGVAGFKAYTISGMDTFKDLSYEEIYRAARLISKTGKPLAVHAEDKTIINSNALRFNSEELRKWESYCEMRSSEAEAAAVAKLIEITEQTNCRMHIVHLSSNQALTNIKNAQKRGLMISAETCPHYLYFTQDSFNNNNIKNYLKTAPPVKSELDREALWQGINEGAVAFITTDHAGCDPDKEKTSDDFSKIYGGIPGVEQRVPFLFSEGFLKGKINLEQTVNMLSSNAAAYFGFKNKGDLKEGYDADIALINLWSSEIVSGRNMHSKGKYTPFEGIKFNAAVDKTFLRGNLIMDKSISSNGTEPDNENKYLGKLICV